MSGDTYAAAASASALSEIDQAVKEAYAAHSKKTAEPPLISTAAALRRLRIRRDNVKRSANLPKWKAVQQSLDDIDRLTRAKSTELILRSGEFRAESPSRATPVPDRESLGRWLQTRADEAHESDVEKSYFAHLKGELSRGRDPWTVSREFLRNPPSPGNGQQAERLQVAHRRLVQAMAHGLSEQPSESGARGLPIGYRWQTAYDAIRARCERDTTERDVFAMAASATALGEIDRAIMDAYHSSPIRDLQNPPYSPADALHSLRQAVRRNAQRPSTRSTAEVMQRSLNDVVRFIFDRHTELQRREHELMSASSSGAAPAPDPETLGRWLWARAGQAQEADVEKSYFAHLGQELSLGRDPWTASGKFLRRLPGAGSAGDAQRLKSAHTDLVQFMAGSLSLQAALSRPAVAQAAGKSLAATSMQ